MTCECDEEVQNKRATRFFARQRTLLIESEICTVILSAAETSYVVSRRCIVRILDELFLGRCSFVL